jgi:hypothetical protein
MHDEGILASYERVTTRLEDARLKNLAADIDCHARDVGIKAEILESTLKFFRDRRELREMQAAVLAGPHRASDAASDSSKTESEDDAKRDRLRKATELHRKRASRSNLN